MEGGKSGKVRWLGKGNGQRKVGQLVIVARATRIDTTADTFVCSAQWACTPIRRVLERLDSNDWFPIWMAAGVLIGVFWTFEHLSAKRCRQDLSDDPRLGPAGQGRS